MPSPCELVENTNIRDKCVEMLKKSNAEDTEYGMLLVRDCCEVAMMPMESGKEHSITLTHSVGEVVASIHTHGEGLLETVFSIQDIQTLLNSGMEFAVLLYDDDGYGYANVYDIETGEANTVKNWLSDETTNVKELKEMNRMLKECTIDLGPI